MEHVPVLRDDVQKCLDLRGGEVVIDATLGLGGHSHDILEKIGKSGTLVAFEQDERNLAKAKENLEKFLPQIVFIQDNFRYLKSRLTERNITQVDAIFFDLGLSSPHVDDPKRGFSFLREGPLDMRFDLSKHLTAYDVVNNYSEDRLADVLYQYAEERASHKLAKLICQRRKTKPFETTTEFAEFLTSILPKKQFRRHGKLHPATKYFQAIRIEVNDELNALKEALEGAIDLLKIGGRIAVISYHSLEDGIVKHFFKDLIQPRLPVEKSLYRIFDDPIVESLAKKPVSPSEEEINLNPRSRSAKLRAYKKLKER